MNRAQAKLLPEGQVCTSIHGMVAMYHALYKTTARTFRCPGCLPRKGAHTCANATNTVCVPKKGTA